jgi:hypothetical protein
MGADGHDNIAAYIYLSTKKIQEDPNFLLQMQKFDILY